MPGELDINVIIVGAVIIGLLAGALLVWLLMRSLLKNIQRQTNEAVGTIDAQRGMIGELRERGATLEEKVRQIPAIKEELIEKSAKIDLLINEKSDLARVVARLKSELQAEQNRSAENLALLDEAREKLKLEFRHLANLIFEEKTNKFNEISKSHLDNLLTPFRTQIEKFEQKVAETYEKEGRERFSLMREVQRLQQLNQQISVDAENLTKALKGDTKTQGTWGEIILERILEESGLRKGIEYDTQGGFRDVDGKLLKPDVVIHLPEEKDVIIDSKVSLVAYERYVRAEGDEERELALSGHLVSINGHLKSLHSKRYEELLGERSLDFVLMFIPIESAFMLAIEKDDEIFRKAFNQNIMIVSPSTLLVTLRTIQNIWRYEYQNRYALEIAEKAGALYDKFVNFVEDLDKVGDHIDRANKAYDGARNKLVSGRGNLVNRVHSLQELGVKSRKKLPAQLLEQAEAEIPNPPSSGDDGSS